MLVGVPCAFVVLLLGPVFDFVWCVGLRRKLQTVLSEF